MKSSLGRLPVRAYGRTAFTIIELLAVMAIILVLAGLIINIAGSASYNSAKARATGEIKAMETALESYKADNGSYPSDSSNVNGGSQPTTEVLDATNTQQYADPSTYTNSSEFLYQALSGFQLTAAGTSGGTATPTVTKAYMTFRPDQLHLAANAPGSTTTASATSAYNYIIDPFGYSYGYSTIYAVKTAANAASGSTQPVTNGYNPTFDLWSTAGYASGGKSTPSTSPSGVTPAQFYSSLWIKNW